MLARYYRRRLLMTSDNRKLRRQISVLFFIILLIILIIYITISPKIRKNDVATFRSRRSTTTFEFDDCKPRIPPSASTNSSQFPADFLTMKAKRQGGVIIHIGLLIYMFVALAVVCDEFFVPSLSVITESLSISDDVAGATFMAAGGSAPEFFTSLFGVFIAQDNVGVGTIVGSATFNILCVLAFCTLFSRQVLHLTWWPLFRDMSFYTLSLFLLLVFFSDEEIKWHEAFIMFSIYIIYGIFMKYNGILEQITKMYLFKYFGIGKDEETATEAATTAGRTPLSPQSMGAGGPRRSFPIIHGGQEVRKSIAQLVIRNEDDSTSSSSSSSSSVTPPNTGKSKKSYRSPRTSLQSAPEIQKNGRTIMVAPAKTENENEDVFIKQNNITTVASLVEFGVNERQNKAKTFLTPVEKFESEANGRTEPSLANGNSVPPIALDNLSVTSTISENPLDLSWPDSIHKRIVYILLAPITFPLALTLPDVRKPNLRKFFAITFVGAILWIATYSYLMVWWASTIGETFEIPTEIMGLTILAAGTSIPDLITSVIVARKGLGDMAVSSSIGSNLFDVCVGLPIPWLIHFILGVFRGGPTQNISVTSNGLVCSLGLLFAMLIVLLACVAVSRWKMDKFFGMLMIFSYAAFCMLCIFLETGHIKCPLRNSC